MAVIDEIKSNLELEFSPTHLEVEDQSEAHRGHSGFQEGGESHFHVIIRAAAFTDMSRVGRHRAVNAAIGADIIGRIHALSLDIDS